MDSLNLPTAADQTTARAAGETGCRIPQHCRGARIYAQDSRSRPFSLLSYTMNSPPLIRGLPCLGWQLRLPIALPMVQLYIKGDLTKVQATSYCTSPPNARSMLIHHQIPFIPSPPIPADFVSTLPGKHKQQRKHLLRLLLQCQTQ